MKPGERQEAQDELDLHKEECFRSRQVLIHRHIRAGGTGPVREEYKAIRRQEEDLTEKQLRLANQVGEGRPGVWTLAARRAAQNSRLQRRLWFIMLILAAAVLALAQMGRVSSPVVEPQAGSSGQGPGEQD